MVNRMESLSATSGLTRIHTAEQPVHSMNTYRRDESNVSPLMSTWQPHVDEWLRWLKAGGASKHTLYLRRYQLARLHQDMRRTGPWSVTPTQLSDWLAGHDWKPETLRSYRAALRSFFGWAHAAGRINSDPARLLRKVTTPPPKPRPASESSVAAALGAADTREVLMLLLGSRHGLRRAEISQVHTSDVTEESDGWALLVHGKGNKDRYVPLLDVVAAAIRRAPAGWLFPNGKGTHLSAPHVGVLLRRLLPTGTTPHQLRHRFATKAYQATLDIRAVQQLLGHASVSTTQLYVQVADDALRRAVVSAA